MPTTAAAMTTAPKVFDLVVIGGGSAGLTAAKFATTFGKTAVLIEREALGGDCTWTGCVPSKTLLASSKVAHVVQTASTFGISTTTTTRPRVDWKVIQDRLGATRDRIYQKDDSPQVLENKGVTTLVGQAKLETSRRVRIENEGSTTDDDKVLWVEARHGIVIASGAGARRESIDQLFSASPSSDQEKVAWSTYEEIFSLKELPARLTVVGGGPVGCELAQALSRLGSAVTIITPKPLLSSQRTMEPEVSEVMENLFTEVEGITIVRGKVKSIASAGGTSHVATVESTDGSPETVEGDLILLAVGRRPRVQGMDLDKVGVQYSANGIVVNDQLETSVRGIYAAGDCTGDAQFTHYAGYQGAVAARNILLPFSDPGKLSTVPSTTFTSPEVASVGLTEAQAKKEWGEGNVGVSLRFLEDMDRAICDGTDSYIGRTGAKTRAGFLKIVYRNNASSRILGATVVAPVAGEIIGELSVAVQTKMGFDQLATVMHTYPAYGFELQAMAAEIYYDKLVKNKWLYDFLKRLGL